MTKEQNEKKAMTKKTRRRKGDEEKATKRMKSAKCASMAAMSLGDGYHQINCVLGNTKMVVP